MDISDMGDSQYQGIVDPSLLQHSSDPAEQGSFFDEIYPFGIPGGDFADAPQGDAAFDFDGLDFDQHAIQSDDGEFATPITPQPSFPDQRYVSFPPQSQTHPSSVWRPLEQPVQQFHYPSPDIFSQSLIAPTPYYPLRPLSSANTTTQHSFRAITPPGRQVSSIDRPLFLHGNMGPPPVAAGIFPYGSIQNYQDDGTLDAEDLALSDIPEDLIATAIREGWTLPEENTQQGSLPDDLYVPNTGNDIDSDLSDAPEPDADYRPSSFAKAKRPRRNRKPTRPKAILPNGDAKKGRPCAKPQTEERRRINERRMEGYYRRKFDQGNLEKARLQSKESYYRRKQRRIESGEKVRSYGAPKKGRANKKT
ncbi:MAG: hypothetical protein ASARMPREDX12_008738 [Alectoria sarmentosa]|nr:MAG: hypothetical protein ASARMPREDX12_008738 [Alectoria sarmentosa]